MLKCSSILLLVFIVCSARNTTAQPNLFNYCAVARHSNGLPVIASTISIKISILKSSPQGNLVFGETHQIITDSMGLFSLIIGNGQNTIGNISTIGWMNDSYFLKVGVDISGGNNFITQETRKLLSVPYALHSKTTGSLINGSSGNIGGTGFSHYIGEYFGGGIIFHLFKDVSGIEHGLIVDINELGDSQWAPLNATIGVLGESFTDGIANTNAIVQHWGGWQPNAAELCYNSNNGGQSDWYLPSVFEFAALVNNIYFVEKALSQIPTAIGIDPFDYYWTSTEIPNPLYYLVLDNSYDEGYYGLGSELRVRSIRAF